ncbi:helix-turn-helix transcriptional regulator [Cohaesibacter gelatinilyticus]|uniref:Regulatory protein, luxR family n=1 Tax=Cohaesibacter gelatinilyticus TaxID=372072 RepID=A0A285NCM0_9HYPH|nr:helix-turn-helix transcriptional regulator [Cohaesibacter gelatinilyticus]SNZ07242.1 regulatory protein, luxR family [Cohaesibacter gelatinilyticus]
MAEEPLFKLIGGVAVTPYPCFATPVFSGSESNCLYIQEITKEDVVTEMCSVSENAIRDIAYYDCPLRANLGDLGLYAYHDLNGLKHVGQKKQIAETLVRDFSHLYEYPYLSKTIASFLNNKEFKLVARLRMEVMDRACLYERSKNGIKLHISKREIEVFSFIINGRGNEEIADALGISENTVYTHVSNVKRKTESINRLEAVVKLFRLGYISKSLYL